MSRISLVLFGIISAMALTQSSRADELVKFEMESINGKGNFSYLNEKGDPINHRGIDGVIIQKGEATVGCGSGSQINYSAAADRVTVTNRLDERPVFVSFLIERKTKIRLTVGQADPKIVVEQVFDAGPHKIKF